MPAVAGLRRPRHPLRALRALLVARSPAVYATSFLVIFWNSWRPAWSGDETASVMVVRRSWPGALRTVRFDAALEPYYLLLKVWSAPSTSHLWLRLPSVLAMAGAVTALAALMGRLVGSRAGLATAFVMLAMPATSRFGQEARPYSLAVLLVVLLVACWARDDLTTRPRRQVELTALVVLAGAVHPYTLAVVPVLVLTSYLVPRSDRRRETMITARSTGLAILLLVPFLVVVVQHSTGQPNVLAVRPINLVSTAARLPVEILSPPLAVASAACFLVLAAAGLYLAARGRVEPRGAVLTALWLFLPPVLLVALQVVTGSPGLVTRYWLFSLPALAGAGAFALVRLRPRAAVAAVCIAIVAVSAPTEVVARTADGHLGRGWVLLPSVLDRPGLARAPLLAGGWNYHGLVANDPAVAARMPLVLDPSTSGRVVPQHDRPGSAAFAALVRRDHLVVALASARSPATTIPSASGFAEFTAELRAFPVAVVQCRWFGQALGVFTTAAAGLTPAAARLLAAEIRAASPRDVRCAADPRP